MAARCSISTSCSTPMRSSLPKALARKASTPAKRAGALWPKNHAPKFWRCSLNWQRAISRHLAPRRTIKAHEAACRVIWERYREAKVSDDVRRALGAVSGMDYPPGMETVTFAGCEIATREARDNFLVATVTYQIDYADRLSL